MCTCIAKWPNLETGLKNWIVDHRQKSMSVSIKMIISEVRRWVVARSITDFIGTAFKCYRFIKRRGISMIISTRVAQEMPAKQETDFAISEVCS